MNTSLNRYRFVRWATLILQKLRGHFPRANPVRETVPAVQPGVLHASSRAAPGLRPVVKPIRDRFSRSSSRPKSVLSLADVQPLVLRLVSSLHNKERAHEANPLISANTTPLIVDAAAGHAVMWPGLGQQSGLTPRRGRRRLRPRVPCGLFWKTFQAGGDRRRLALYRRDQPRQQVPRFRQSDGRAAVGNHAAGGG